MELIVNKQEEISLNELIEKKDEGLSVVRSAHVGNSRMYNLVLAEAGVDMLLVDHNQTARDRNYLPHLVIVNDEIENLTDSQNTLSLRTRSERTQDEGRFLDEIHTSSLGQAFFDTNVFTNTEYLRSNETIVAEIVNICSLRMPNLFNRLVLPDGTTDKRPGASDLVRTSGILQLTDNPRSETLAVMMPNELDIICGFVIEAINTGTDTQYHVSGPDMINYIKGIMPNLQKIYGLFSSASFANKLPKKLSVELVPGTPLGLATTKNNFARLKPLTDYIEEMEDFEEESNKKRRAVFEGRKPSKNETKDLLDSIKSDRDRIQSMINEAASQSSELLSDLDSTTYTTQYDSLEHGGLFVPKITRELSIKKLAKIMRALKAGPS